MESFESFDVAVVRRSRFAAVLLAAPLLMGAALLAHGAREASGAVAGAGALVMWGGYIAWLLGSPDVGRRIERVAHLRADTRGIYLDGDLAIGRGVIRRAYLQPRRGDVPSVVLESRRGALELLLRDELRAQALLRAIGFDPARSSLRFGRMFVEENAGSLSLAAAAPIALLVGGIVAVFAVLDGDAPLVIPIAVGALVLALTRHLRAADVTVGADGVSYTRLGRTTFVPRASIESVEATPGGAVLSLARGSRVALRFAPSRHGGAPTPEADAFVARLRALHAEHRPTQAPFVAETLARGSRASRDWLRDLRTLGKDGDAAYRGAVIPIDHLWQVLEDPAAGSSARAGAAVALSAALDDLGRARIRVAAEGCASPALRVALHAVSIDASGDPHDEDAIARALDDASECESDLNVDDSPSAGAPRSRP